MPEPIDIVMLAFNRLDYLEATVDALEARTPEPYRLTIVDNASGPDVRNWLWEQRARFHQLILRPENEHIPAFQHGIAATTSDPYLVAEPDLIVPEVQPSWLARMRALMDRHPDFGLIGMGLDPINRPPVLGPEPTEPRVGDDLMEGNVGIWFQMIRRDALVVDYRRDAEACDAVRMAGYRVGWTTTLRAHHLGWDDYKLHPGHLATKGPRTHSAYPHYRELELVERPPTLTELANAAPVLAVTRAANVPDASVLELTWSRPAVAAAAPAAVCVERPDAGRLPLADGAAGAVALIDPPAGVLPAAFRVAASTVVALADLSTFGGRSAGELAPPGWTAREAPGPAEVPLSLAKVADADPALADRLGYQALEQREHWLALFAAGAFGAASRRLWIWTRETPLPLPERVRCDAAALRAWTPAAPAVAPPPRRGLADRARRRVDDMRLWQRTRAARS